MGEALGDFLQVDDESSDIFHSTFARILVEMDVSKGLPAEVVLKSSKGSWIQSLDYEGIPFRCRRCFKIGHATAPCEFEKKAKKATWWNGASQHYTVEKKSDQHRSFFEVVASESQGLGTSSQDAPNDGAAMASPIEQVTRSLAASPGVSATTSMFGGSSDKSLPTQRNNDEISKTMAAGIHLQDNRELAWLDKATQLEEGWIIVKGKKGKISRPYFDMTLCSHKNSVIEWSC